MLTKTSNNLERVTHTHTHTHTHTIKSSNKLGLVIICKNIELVM